MKNKLIYSVVGIALLVFGLIAGLILVQKQQDIREKAAPSTNLSVVPSTQSKNTGTSFTIKVVADTGENSVTGIDIVLNYDKAVFEIISVVGGEDISGFSTVIKNQVDSNNGKILYSAFALDPQKFAKGASVETLVVNGKVLENAKQGTYSFSFDNQSAISGSSEGQNILVGSSSGTVVVVATPEGTVVTGGVVSPTFTATPTSTSVAKSTPTPTATSTIKTSTPTAHPMDTATSISSNGNKTATPTNTSTSNGTATVKGTSKSTQTLVAVGSSTATAFPVPETGNGFNSIVMGGTAIILILMSVLLII